MQCEDNKQLQVALNRLYYERKEFQSAKQRKNTKEQKAGSDPAGPCGFRRVRLLFTCGALRSYTQVNNPRWYL